MVSRRDFEFANNVRAAIEQRAPRTAWLLLFFTFTLIAAALAWAHFAILDEVTTAAGRVIPSKQLQSVQTLEGGIVREISSREGDQVSKGQVLMRIDDTGFASQLGEVSQRRWALLSEIARLEAEANSRPDISFDPGLLKNAAPLAEAEKKVFRIRRMRLAGDLDVLRQQLTQRQEELAEFEARHAKLVATLRPLSRELELTRRLNDRGVVPEIELMRLERQFASMKGEQNVVKASLLRAQSAIEEARKRIANAQTLFRTIARERLAKARAELAIIEETRKAARDRVKRTSLRAPVTGVVNNLTVKTIGAVLKPGQVVAEIVPTDDTLLIEAQIRPKDIAFIQPGQDSNVKFTAYDYSIFGTLDGKVERISADTFTNTDGNTFYRVIVRTSQRHMGTDAHKLPVLPGMVATVDITTGKKSVLAYLLKPVLKVRSEAMRER